MVVILQLLFTLPVEFTFKELARIGNVVEDGSLGF
jgi:hypothetical protein